MAIHQALARRRGITAVQIARTQRPTARAVVVAVQAQLAVMLLVLLAGMVVMVPPQLFPACP